MPGQASPLAATDGAIGLRPCSGPNGVRVWPRLDPPVLPSIRRQQHQVLSGTTAGQDSMHFGDSKRKGKTLDGRGAEDQHHRHGQPWRRHHPEAYKGSRMVGACAWRRKMNGGHQ